MKTIRQKLLRLRLRMDKKAKARYDALQVKRRCDEISLKAQLHHEEECRAVESVRRKAAANDGCKMKAVVRSDDAKHLGDKVLLTGRLIPAETRLIQVEEAAVTEDQFRDMLNERHTLISNNKKQMHRRKHRPVEKLDPETVTIDPRDALHFMTTGKIPVRTRAELTEIVDMGGIKIEEVEVTSDDAAAMLYFSERNHRK